MTNSRFQFVTSGYYRIAEVVASVCVAVFVHPAVVFGFHANAKKTGYWMVAATLIWAVLQLAIAGPLHPFLDRTPMTFLDDLGDFLVPGLVFFISGALLRNIPKFAKREPGVISSSGPTFALTLALTLAGGATFCRG